MLKQRPVALSFTLINHVVSSSRFHHMSVVVSSCPPHHFGNGQLTKSWHLMLQKSIIIARTQIYSNLFSPSFRVVKRAVLTRTNHFRPSIQMSQSRSIPPPNQRALALPPGVPAEFSSPYTLRPYQALTIVASVIATTVMVAARLYTKKLIVRALKWEDCK